MSIGHSLRARVAIGAAVSALIVGSCSAALAAAAAPEVRVSEGLVRGQVKDGIRVFSGIPFAAPPVGALRFRPPQPPKPWTGVRDATQAPESCPQNAGGGDPSGKGSTNEDCLFVNVFAPVGKTAAKRPVMVWIHGGGWNEGYAFARGYDPTPLVKGGGIVVVNISYRLGALGLLATKSLDEANGEPSGNYLIRDHLQALAWVKKNIAVFGGDPANVTLVGESAGANSILALVTTPLAKGLFQKAIVQSGVDDAHTHTRATAEKAGEQLAEAVGCKEGPDQVDCLRKVPVETFLKIRSKLGLVIDPALFPVDPYVAYRDGAFNHVPFIIGSNLHEGYFFASSSERAHAMTEAEYAAQMKTTFGADADAAMKAYPVKTSPAAAYGDAVTDARFACYMDLARMGASKYAPIYGFEMNEPDPAQQLPRKPVSLPNTSYHTSDLAYLFDYDTAPLKGDAEKLSKTMRGAWLQFMRTGSPNGKGLPSWPRFRPATGKVLNLSNTDGLTTDFAVRHNCAALQQSGLVSFEWN